MDRDIFTEVLDNDTGDTWWVVGHHDDATAIAKVQEYLRACGVLDEFDDDPLTVARLYYRDAHDPTTDERWERCEATDEGAEPFTEVST